MKVASNKEVVPKGDKSLQFISVDSKCSLMWNFNCSASGHNNLVRDECNFLDDSAGLGHSWIGMRSDNEPMVAPERG